MTPEEALALLERAESRAYALVRLHDDDETYELMRLVYGDGDEATGVVAAARVLVKAERERCAKIADEGCEQEATFGQGQSAWVAAKIREG